MSLHRLARFVVLIWLPLASFKQDDKPYLNRLFSSTKNLAVSDEHEEKNVVENITEKVEENPLKKQTDNSKVFVVESNASDEFIANPLDLKSSDSAKGETSLTNAHKVKGSVKKDLSALHVNNSVKNESATMSERHLDTSVKSSRSKIGKRKAVMEIFLENSSQSMDDYEEEETVVVERRNSTEMGSYLGAPCEVKCNENLLHVFCHPTNRICECEEKYPVQIDAGTGCEKPKKLGDQCFYAETCSFFDPNAVCMQINHNAICQCRPGFHTVALRKGVKRMFCSEDIAVVSADLSTLLGIATGIAVLTGLICFVLRLFSGNRYPSSRHYANANLAPSLLLSNDNQWINGIPLTVHARPPSRSSCQRSTMSLAQYSRNKGVLVPASRAGAARAAAILLIPYHLQASKHSEATNNSITDDSEVRPNDLELTYHLGSRRHSFSSVQSTTSSQKNMSYSARRFEQENQQREQRAAMKAAREEAERLTVAFTPSSPSTNGIIIPFSKDTEEDPLCSHTEDPPSESEPPAFSITQDIIPLKLNSPK